MVFCVIFLHSVPSFAIIYSETVTKPPTRRENLPWPTRSYNGGVKGKPKHQNYNLEISSTTKAPESYSRSKITWQASQVPSNVIGYKNLEKTLHEKSEGSLCEPKMSGQFVYLPDCRRFINCFKGRGYIQACAPGTLFNPESHECDFPNKVRCLTSPAQYKVNPIYNQEQHYDSEPVVASTNRHPFNRGFKSYKVTQPPLGHLGVQPSYGSSYQQPETQTSQVEPSQNFNIGSPFNIQPTFNSHQPFGGNPPQYQPGYVNTYGLPNPGYYINTGVYPAAQSVPEQPRRQGTYIQNEYSNIYLPSKEFQIPQGSDQSGSGINSYPGFPGQAHYPTQSQGSQPGTSQSPHYQQPIDSGIPIYSQSQNGQTPNYGKHLPTQPSYSQSQSGQPGNRHSYEQTQGGQPNYGQPIYSQPPNLNGDQTNNGQTNYGLSQGSQPSYGQPQSGQPNYGEPSSSQPTYGQPNNGQPNYYNSQRDQFQGKPAFEKTNGQPNNGQFPPSNQYPSQSGQPNNGQSPPGNQYPSQNGQPTNTQPNYFPKQGGYPGSPPTYPSYQPDKNQFHNTNKTEYKPPIVTDDGRVKCPDGASGLYPHPSNCYKFLNCDHGRTFIMDCGPGTAFNPKISVCDYPNNVDCSGTENNEDEQGADDDIVDETQQPDWMYKNASFESTADLVEQFDVRMPGEQKPVLKKTFHIQPENPPVEKPYENIPEVSIGRKIPEAPKGIRQKKSRSTEILQSDDSY
uniref:Chitin-binding type-2 domain-containing protein n=1 Tax=Clastoptera arizonana TaxID=38151 RepID=A0A1B6CJC3_9HEMI